jgi:hypothetical protein
MRISRPAEYSGMTNLRYGERTARGAAGGTKVTWALTVRDRRRARSGKKIMVSCDTMKDIALFRLPVTLAPENKNNRGRIGDSQSGKGQLQGSGQGMRIPGRLQGASHDGCQTAVHLIVTSNRVE